MVAITRHDLKKRPFSLSPVQLLLTPPPSVNGVFVNGSRPKHANRHKSERYEKWLAETITRIRLQGAPYLDGRVIAVIGVSRSTLAADIDNRLKPTLDVLVKAKVISDDKMVTAIATSWEPDDRTMNVLLIPVQQATFTFRPTDDLGATGGWTYHPEIDNGD